MGQKTVPRSKRLVPTRENPDDVNESPIMRMYDEIGISPLTQARTVVAKCLRLRESRSALCSNLKDGCGYFATARRSHQVRRLVAAELEGP